MRCPFLWTQVLVPFLKIDINVSWDPGLSLFIQVDFFLNQTQVAEIQGNQDVHPGSSSLLQRL